jgi:hypothetical protein
MYFVQPLMAVGIGSYGRRRTRKDMRRKTISRRKRKNEREEDERSGRS